MASPHAAALAAMIRSARPDLSNAEVMDIMRNTSVDLGAQGQDSYFGYGQIDVKNALSAVTGRQNDNADTGPATGAGWLRDQLESIKKWLGS